MKQVTTALVAIACITFSAFDSVQAQSTKTVSVGFRNTTDTAVIVQGYTVVNGVRKSGQPLSVNKRGGVAFDLNVPSGVRYYTVYDANQPSRILLRDHPVPVQFRDAFLAVATSLTQPGRFLLIPVDPAP